MPIEACKLPNTTDSNLNDTKQYVKICDDYQNKHISALLLTALIPMWIIMPLSGYIFDTYGTRKSRYVYNAMLFLGSCLGFLAHPSYVSFF